MKDFLWVSFGENCLGQTIINSVNFNTINTPYSYSYSNIEYVLHFENTNYETIIDRDNFIFDNSHNTEDVKNTGDCFPIRYLNSDFSISVPSPRLNFRRDGFFFWHSNILNNEDEYNKTVRRAQRMKELRNRDNMVILYNYHSFLDKPELDKIRNGLLELKSKYYKNAKIVLTYHQPGELNKFSVIKSSKDSIEFCIDVNDGMNHDWYYPVESDLHKEMLMYAANHFNMS